MDGVGSPRLRRALLERYPWLADTELGPQAVEAGECDRCGAEARLVAPCGPAPASVVAGAAERGERIGPSWALGRRCAAALGDEAWCDGHRGDAEAALAWLARLPAEADDVARLWWVATGEVRVDPALVAAARRLALPAPG